MTCKQAVVLVTGTSSGFGALAVKHLALEGHRVYATMRNLHLNTAAVEEYSQFSAKHSTDIRVVEMDVTKQNSIDKAIHQVIQESGKIDVLVHNAGHMCYGPLESYTAEQLLSYYDVNAVGAHRVNRVVLPHMRRARSGKMIWVGSTSTAGGTPPFLGPYFAAKAAMDSIAVTCASELSKWGIETTIICPGVFTSGTNHFEHAGKGADGEISAEYLQDSAPYSGVPERVLKGLEQGDSPGDVVQVAKAMVEVVSASLGSAPFRVHVDPWNDGGGVVDCVKDLARKEFYYKMGMKDILEVSKPKA